MVRRINTLSRRWFWWYFQKKRNSISICNLDGKMRKKSIVEKVNFTWFCKGNSFGKIKENQHLGSSNFRHFPLVFFILRSSFHMEIEIRSFRKYHHSKRLNKVLILRTSFSMSFHEFRYEFQQSVKMYRGTVKYQWFWYKVRQSYL